MKDKINRYGQFFTEENLCDYVLNKINEIKSIKGNILEPSFGSGNFINNLEKYNDINLDGVEIDEMHYNNYINNNYNKNVCLHNIDFLKFNNNKKYDFIIGNPPYIELCYSFYSKEEQLILKNKYKGISNGRTNLVHFFMEKSFSLIEEDGIIAYLLPSSILTSPTYKAVRKYIYDNFNVECLIEDVLFKDVAIKVCLLVIRKKKNNGKYFFINDDNYYIMENYNKFTESKTIKDCGFNVNIGEVVWNQKKEILSNNESDQMLIYSNNIEKNKLKIGVKDNDGKKQYIKGYEIKYKNCIIFPRTVSKKIKYLFIKDNNKFIFENHVLVMTHEKIEYLEEFHSKLESGYYDDMLLSFFNSSNLTKTELLSLPF
jgi:adenine-specific DNA-methyltransferase